MRHGRGMNAMAFNQPSRWKADARLSDELWGLAADTGGLLGTSSTCTGAGASAASTLFAVLTTVLAATLGVATLSSITTLGGVAALGVTGFGIALACTSSTSGCTSTGGTGSSACLAVTGLSVAALSVTALGVTGLSSAILARNLDAALGGPGSIILGVIGLGIACDTAALTLAITAVTGVVFSAGGNLAAGDFT